MLQLALVILSERVRFPCSIHFLRITYFVTIFISQSFVFDLGACLSLAQTVGEDSNKVKVELSLCLFN
jgi:hypothetical protein